MEDLENGKKGTSMFGVMDLGKCLQTRGTQKRWPPFGFLQSQPKNGGSEPQKMKSHPFVEWKVSSLHAHSLGSAVGHLTAADPGFVLECMRVPANAKMLA